MNRVDDVKHVLGKSCVPAAFTVIQEDKEDDCEHGPFVVKAQIAVQGISGVSGILRYKRVH